MHRFYIFDCYGQTVGNPKGYRTHKGAERQASMKTSKAYGQIWRAYWSKQDTDPTCKLLYRISAR